MPAIGMLLRMIYEVGGLDAVGTFLRALDAAGVTV
jgi:hypothetical protein